MSLFVRIAPHVYVPRMQNEDDASTPIASCTSIKEPPTTRIDPLHPPGPPPSDGYRLFPTNLVNHSRSFDTHYSLYRKRKFARPINVYTYNCLYYFVNMGNRASVTNRPQIGPDAMNPIATPHIPTSIDRDQEPKSTEHHKQSPMTIVNGIYQWFIIIFLLYLQVTLCRCSSIVMGSYHTCLVSANKRMKCFGRNDDGMLGYGDTNNRGDGPGEMGDSLPDIDLGSDFAVMQIAPASFYTCALSVDSRMKCFGRNWYGVLGQNDLDYRGDEPGEMGDNLPDIYLAAGPGDFKPTQIVSGSFHNCALSDDHMVKCFGDNSYGQQGNGDTMLRGGYAGSMESLIFVDLGTDFQAIRIGSAGDHSCALSVDNRLKCWGFNAYGQLGYGDTNNRGGAPGQMGDNLVHVDLGINFQLAQFAVSYQHTCALSVDNRMKCWGRNLFGQLGYGESGDTTNRGDEPGEMGDNLPDIDLGTGLEVKQIGVGTYRSCVLSVENKIKCFGWNLQGQLGYEDTDNRGDGSGEMGDNLPYIDLGTGFEVNYIAVGGYHSCAVSIDEKAKCFGRNDFGQLGNGHTRNIGDGKGEMGDFLLPIDIPSITLSPTNPTSGPMNDVTSGPTDHPTTHPTLHPTLHPSHGPTNNPSVYPIITPTSDPLYDPTSGYTTAYPTSNPSQIPSYSPTEGPLTEWSIDTTDDDAGYSEPVVSDNDSTYIIIIVCLCCIMCIYLTYKGVKKVLVKRKASIDEGNIDQNVHAQQPGAAHAHNNRYEYPADALHAIQYSDDQEQKEGQREREKEGHNSQPTTGERTHGGGDVLSALETTQGGITQGGTTQGGDC
eukprot:159612_1